LHVTSAPIWAREDPRPVPTHAQLGADLVGRELPAHPVAQMPDGQKVDVRTAHVADVRNRAKEQDPA